MERNYASRSRLLADRRFDIQTLPFGDRQNVEVRIEAVNLFNHVNLGNPNRRSGCREQQLDAGRIKSTAFGNADPQRNFQFAAKVRI